MNELSKPALEESWLKQLTRRNRQPAPFGCCLKQYMPSLRSGQASIYLHPRKGSQGSNIYPVLHADRIISLQGSRKTSRVQSRLLLLFPVEILDGQKKQATARSCGP